MPIKSQAQRRKFAELLVEGKIEPETYERWNREAGSAHLPERVRPKRRAKRAKKTRPARAKSATAPKKTRKAKRTTKKSKRPASGRKTAKR